MKPSEAVGLIKLMRGVWPQSQMPPETCRLYGELLSDLDYEACWHAVMSLAATSKFLPAISEIRQCVAERDVDAPDPESAWGEVMRAILSVGRYREPQFSHAAITTAVDDLGWQSICNSDEEGLGVLRAHFYRTYAARKTRQMQSVQVRPLLTEHRGPQLAGDVVTSLLPARRGK